MPVFQRGRIERAEFEQWDAYAIGLRARAFESDLPFGEYQRLIKK